MEEKLQANRNESFVERKEGSESGVLVLIFWGEGSFLR